MGGLSVPLRLRLRLHNLQVRRLPRLHRLQVRLRLRRVRLLRGRRSVQRLFHDRVAMVFGEQNEPRLDQRHGEENGPKAEKTGSRLRRVRNG